MKIRTKWTCDTVIQHPDQRIVTLKSIPGNPGELDQSKQFAVPVPPTQQANIIVIVNNPNPPVFDYFKAGDDFYIDFVPAPEG